MGETGINIPDMYRGLVQHLPNTSAIIFDLERRILLAEGPLVDRLMTWQGDVIGKRPEERLPAEVAPEIIAIQTRALAGETFNFEQHYSFASYHSYANPIKDDAGEIIGGMIVTHDVTETTRTQTALRASESLFHSLVNLIPVGIIQTDVEGNRVFCNTAWCEMTGVTLEEALRDVNYGTIHPDDLETSSRPWLTMMKTNKPFENAVFRYLRPDGDFVWVSGNGTPLYDELGNVTGYLGSVTNIDAQLRTQAALRESETRYRSVVNTMSEGLILQGRDGTVQAINPAAERIIGLTMQEMLEYDESNPKWPLIHEDGSPFPNDKLPLTMTLRTGEPQTNVMVGMRTPDRSLHWISTSSRPIFTENDTLPSAALVTMNDVTELYEAHARLQQERDLLRTVIDNTP
jgi:PAS domain S-box-containing protein